MSKKDSIEILTHVILAAAVFFIYKEFLDKMTKAMEADRKMWHDMVLDNATVTPTKETAK